MNQGETKPQGTVEMQVIRGNGPRQKAPVSSIKRLWDKITKGPSPVIPATGDDKPVCTCEQNGRWACFYHSPDMT